MKQLSSLDATFLHLETAEMPMHVGALNIYELPAGFKGSFLLHLRRHLAERLPLLPVLRRRLWWMPLNLANPVWVDAEPDLQHHVTALKLPPSARQGDGMTELEAAVSRLHAVRLARDRPLWRFYLLEGLGPTPDGRKRVGLYAQFHHAAVDGQAAVAVAQVILDTTPAPRDLDIRPSRRSKVLRLGLGQMLRGAVANEASQVAGIIKNLPSTLSTLAGAAGQALSQSALLRGKGKGGSVGNLSLAPRTAFNQSVSVGRVFAGVSLPLAQLKLLGRAHGATLNDLVLLICATALRRYLGQHAALPRKSLVAAVPVSLRAQGDTSATTQASISLVSLGTHIPDLARRLAHVKAASAAMKQTMGNLKSVLPTDFPSIGLPWLMEAATALYGKAKVAERIPLLANLTISNVPGPPVPLYLAGARMVSNFPASIVMHGIGLNITVESYDRQLDFGLVADAQAMPDVRALADAIRIAFDDLCLLDQPEVAAAPASLADTGRAVVGQARKRLSQGLSQVGESMSSAVGSAVGSLVSGVVRGVVKGTVGPVVGAGKARRAAAAAAPAAEAAPAAAPLARRARQAAPGAAARPAAPPSAAAPKAARRSGGAR